jgi:hypothetical protein
MNDRLTVSLYADDIFNQNKIISTLFRQTI